MIEFAIGLEFYCDARRWRCTDVGTRVVIAIALDHEADPTWYSGPPYAVAERVFDEDDQEGCSLIPEEIDCFAPVSLDQASGTPMEYIAYLHKKRKSDFGVSFPDFPGCVTAGKTLEEARCMAAKALALHIQGMAEDGETIPKPSTIDDVADDPALTGAVAFLVSVGLEKAVL
jgi:predicted RNase H-like HicB family nuclease